MVEPKETMPNEAKGTVLGPWRLVALCGLTVLVAILIAKQFIGEGGWVDAVAQSGAFVLGLGVAGDVVARTTSAAAYRNAILMAALGVIALGFINTAVGIIGSDNNPANRMYFAVFAIGALGALVARLRPTGMAWTMAAAAAAQATIAAVALVGQLGGASAGTVEILTINGAFVAVFLGSAVLFKRASIVDAGRAA